MPGTAHYLPPYQRRGVLFVLSGPSGVGKDALLIEVTRRETSPENRVERAITATTRPPRPAEVPGQDYLFWTEAQFRESIMQDELLEWAEVYGNMYGTPRSGIEQKLAEGRSVVLKIDVQGAASVRRAMPEAVLIFLSPPSLAELESRLRNRLTDTADAIDRRLATALHEMQLLPDYDYVVVNDDLSTAADEVRAIFLAEQRRVKTIQALQSRPKPSLTAP